MHGKPIHGEYFPICYVWNIFCFNEAAYEKFMKISQSFFEFYIKQLSGVDERLDRFKL